MHTTSIKLGERFTLPIDLLGVPLDPYLLWAQMTRWAEFLGPATASVPVAIVLREQKFGSHLVEAVSLAHLEPTDLNMPPVYLDRRFVTAQVSQRFIETWYRHERIRECVESVELGLPMVVDRSAFDEPVRIERHKPALPLIGIVDHGFAFAHADFTRPATGGTRTSRVVTLWDQDALAPAFGTVTGAEAPPLFGFGRELLGAQFKALLKVLAHGESAVYEAADYRALRPRATHGTHVASLAAGRLPPSHRLGFGVSSVRPPPPPADCDNDFDLALVQLPRAAVQDSSGRWLSVHMLDALHHILKAAAADQPVIVNISYGSRVGPHDGTSFLERAMVDLLATTNVCKHRLDIVLAAGNAFDSRSHAMLELRDDGPSVVDWQVAAGSEATTFVELWLPAGLDASGIQVSLVPPEAAGNAIVASGGQLASWIDSAGRVQASIQFPLATPLGQQGTCALLTIAPTWQRGAGVRAPAGRWQIQVSAIGASAGEAAGQVLHAYLARNDSDFGVPRRGRLSHFIGGQAYDPRRYLRAAVDDARPPQPGLQRLGTLSWNVQFKELHVVAGYVHRPYADATRADALRRHPPYGSAGPARAPAPRAGPSGAMPSDTSPVWRGVRAAGTRGASTVRLVGTSSAVPQKVRELANLAACPTIPPPANLPLPSPPPSPFPSRDEAFFGGLRRPP